MAAATHATCLCDEPYVCCSCYIQVWSISRSYFYPLSVSVSVSELCLWLYLRLFSVSVYVSSLLFSLFFLSLSPGKIKYVLSKERRMMILYLSIRSFYSRTKFDVLSCLIHVSTSTQRMSKSAGWSSTRKICGACYCKGQIGYFFLFSCCWCCFCCRSLFLLIVLLLMMVLFFIFFLFVVDVLLLLYLLLTFLLFFSFVSIFALVPVFVVIRCDCTHRRWDNQCIFAVQFCARYYACTSTKCIFIIMFYVLQAYPSIFST